MCKKQAAVSPFSVFTPLLVMILFNHTVNWIKSVFRLSKTSTIYQKHVKNYFNVQSESESDVANEQDFGGLEPVAVVGAPPIDIPRTE